MTVNPRPAETWEYAYLHLMWIEGIGDPPKDMWVTILDQVVGHTVEAEAGLSALEIINRLGQDGWIIPDGHPIRVDNDDVSSDIRAHLDIVRTKFGPLGRVRNAQSRWISRRIVWDD